MDLGHTDAVVAIQDLGAAGLTSSVAECAGRVPGAGARIDVSRVPKRERGMKPYDVMLSESQERMLVVVRRGREAEVEGIFRAWDLTSAVIGEVTDDGYVTVVDGSDMVARLPVDPRVGQDEAVGRELARVHRDNGARNARLDHQFRRMQRPRPAEGAEREVARIQAALDEH